VASRWTGGVGGIRGALRCVGCTGAGGRSVVTTRTTGDEPAGSTHMPLAYTWFPVLGSAGKKALFPSLPPSRVSNSLVPGRVTTSELKIHMLDGFRASFSRRIVPSSPSPGRKAATAGARPLS